MVVIRILLIGCLLAPLLSNADELKVITINTYPWAYHDDQHNKYFGLFPSIISEIETRTGYKIKISLSDFSFARIDRELRAGRQDCSVNISIVDDNRDFVIYGETLIEHHMGVVARKGLKLDEYSDLMGLSVSVNDKLFISESFYLDKGFRKEYDVDYLTGIEKLVHGRVDAVAGAIKTINELAKFRDFDGFLGQSLKLGLTPISLQCSKKSKKLYVVAEVNEAIKSMKIDGTMQKIVSKYGL